MFNSKYTTLTSLKIYIILFMIVIVATGPISSPNLSVLNIASAEKQEQEQEHERKRKEEQTRKDAEERYRREYNQRRQPRVDKDEYYCKILGISMNATNKEITAAYRMLCLKYHPDRCTYIPWEDANTKMALINEAYENVLLHAK